MIATAPRRAPRAASVRSIAGAASRATACMVARARARAGAWSCARSCVWSCALAPLAVVLLLVLAPAPARADAVDDAFVRGNAAAQAGDWDAAIEAYEQAASLLPERSAVLSYDLGTAYLHRGDLGRATYHLRRALDWRGGPTAELVESARYNLAIARRRAELRAVSSGAKIDRPETWWDLVVEALRAPGVGWSALVAGWLAVGLLGLRGRRRGRGQAPSTPLGVTLIVCASVYVALGVLHGLALRADRTAPEAIVLQDLVDVRDGAGHHRPVAFRIQGGARVRVVGHSPGWSRIRLPGGLEGWVREDAVGELADRGTPRGEPPRPSSPSASGREPSSAEPRAPSPEP